MRITFLGVNGFPAMGNKTIATLIEIDGYKILLDCGTSIIEQLENESLLVSDLDMAIITHIHADHAGGVPLLFFANIMERLFDRCKSNKDTLNLWMEKNTFDNYIPIIKSAYAPFFGESPPAKIILSNIPNKKETQNKLYGFNIKTIPLFHSVPVIGIRLEIQGKVLCYISDSRMKEGLAEFIEGADILLCNVFGCLARKKTADRIGFMTSADAGYLAEEAGVENLVLQHLFYFDQDREACYHDVLKVFSGNVLIPQNGEKLTLG